MLEKQLDLRRFIELQRLLLLSSFATFTPKTFDSINGLSALIFLDDATPPDPRKELENAMSLLKLHIDSESFRGI